MLTIVHLIPTLEGGGSERQLAMLATEQARRGYTVHIGSRRGGVHKEHIRDRRVEIHTLGDLRALHPMLIAHIGSLFRRIKPDIVQTWLPQMDIVGGLVALSSSRPWILSERSSRGAYENAPVPAWARRRLGQYAKAIVANSAEGADYWARALPAPKNVSTVANAVDIAAIRDAVPIPCQPQGEIGHTLLFVGRLVPEKAPEILLQALSQIPELHKLQTLIIGDGPLRDEVLASIAACGLEKRMKVLPYQTNWWGFLKTAAAIVSTSRLEGQPNVVLEAMAAECPLIVSDIPPHRAILNERSALIVPPDDPNALSDAIVSLLADPVAARVRAKCAFKRVTPLTIQATADGYERVYANVLNRPVQ